MIAPALDHPKGYGQTVFFRGGADSPDGSVFERDTDGTILFVIPAQAFKALQDRFAENDQLRFSAIGFHVFKKGLQIKVDLSIDHRRGGQ